MSGPGQTPPSIIIKEDSTQAGRLVKDSYYDIVVTVTVTVTGIGTVTVLLQQ